MLRQVNRINHTELSKITSGEKSRHQSWVKTQPTPLGRCVPKFGMLILLARDEHATHFQFLTMPPCQFSFSENHHDTSSITNPDTRFHLNQWSEKRGPLQTLRARRILRSLFWRHVIYVHSLRATGRYGFAIGRNCNTSRGS